MVYSNRWTTPAVQLLQLQAVHDFPMFITTASWEGKKGNRVNMSLTAADKCLSNSVISILFLDNGFPWQSFGRGRFLMSILMLRLCFLFSWRHRFIDLLSPAHANILVEHLNTPLVSRMKKSKHFHLLKCRLSQSSCPESTAVCMTNLTISFLSQLFS